MKQILAGALLIFLFASCPGTLGHMTQSDWDCEVQLMRSGYYSNGGHHAHR